MGLVNDFHNKLHVLSNNFTTIVSNHTLAKLVISNFGYVIYQLRILIIYEIYVLYKLVVLIK